MQEAGATVLASSYFEAAALHRHLDQIAFPFQFPNRNCQSIQQRDLSDTMGSPLTAQCFRRYEHQQQLMGPLRNRASGCRQPVGKHFPDIAKAFKPARWQNRSTVA
jgi:hypothetical protein